MSKQTNITHIDYLRYIWQLFTGFRSCGEDAIAQRRWKDVSHYLEARCTLRVLDLANGYLRPQYSILKANGYQVYGVDLVNYPRRNVPSLAYQFARLLYRWRLGIPKEKLRNATLICGDVKALPLPDACFDLVTSVAV